MASMNSQTEPLSLEKLDDLIEQAAAGDGECLHTVRETWKRLRWAIRPLRLPDIRQRYPTLTRHILTVLKHFVKLPNDVHIEVLWVMKTLCKPAQRTDEEEEDGFNTAAVRWVSLMLQKLRNKEMSNLDNILKAFAQPVGGPELCNIVDCTLDQLQQSLRTERPAAADSEPRNQEQQEVDSGVIKLEVAERTPIEQLVTSKCEEYLIGLLDDSIDKQPVELVDAVWNCMPESLKELKGPIALQILFTELKQCVTFVENNFFLPSSMSDEKTSLISDLLQRGQEGVRKEIERRLV